MKIIARMTLDFYSEAALAVVRNAIPSRGVNFQTETVFPDENECSQSDNIQDNNKSNGHRGGRRPANGKKSIAEILIEAFGDHESFSNQQANDAIEVYYNPSSASSAIKRMIENGDAARIGYGCYKIIKEIEEEGTDFPLAMRA